MSSTHFHFVADGPVPEAWTEVVVFAVDDLLVGLRPIHPEDRDALLEGFEEMSEQSRYQRFLAPMSRLTHRQVDYLTDIDQIDHFAWVAGVFEGDEEHGIGVARYVRDASDTTSAELAVTVSDEFQGRGIGTLLVEALVSVAAARGFATIYGVLFAENEPMARIFKRIGARFDRIDGSVLRASTSLPVDVTLPPEAVAALVRTADEAARASTA